MAMTSTASTKISGTYTSVDGAFLKSTDVAHAVSIASKNTSQPLNDIGKYSEIFFLEPLIFFMEPTPFHIARQKIGAKIFTREL